VSCTQGYIPGYITDLIPWKKEPEREPKGSALQVRQDPFLSFQQQVNRMFDDFFQGAGMEPFAAIGIGQTPYSTTGC
jgi:hypothetical protein